MPVMRTQPLPPVSQAHIAGLHSLIAQLQLNDQDVTLLAQLADSLPRLRAGLHATERQRIDELDSNQATLATALDTTQAAIESLELIIGDFQQPLAHSILIDATQLQRIAAAAQFVAEAANDLALRAGSRAGLLE